MAMYPIPAAVCLLAVLLATGRSGPAAGAEMTISPDDCRRLVKHSPVDGVTYQEGVDVHGRAVAPADLPNRPAVPLPEVFVFDVEILPLHDDHRRRERRSRRYGYDDDPKRVEEATSMTLGTAIVTPDGRAWFNGVALHDVEQEALLLRCREVLAPR